MNTFTLNSQVWIPSPRTKVFSFFADARNLERLTPSWLSFEIMTKGDIHMSPGKRIDYRLRVHGIPLRWQSEITIWEPPHRFIDEQRRGPYSFWIHEHRFIEEANGTLAMDIVSYGVPGGKLIHKLFVEKDVKKIFNYRVEKLKEIFPNTVETK